MIGEIDGDQPPRRKNGDIPAEVPPGEVGIIEYERHPVAAGGRKHRLISRITSPAIHGEISPQLRKRLTAQPVDQAGQIGNTERHEDRIPDLVDNVARPQADAYAVIEQVGMHITSECRLFG